MQYRAEIRVRLRPVVNDPQGLTVAEGLRSLGFDEVRGARSGKLIELVLESADESTARLRVEEMCRRLLANPVIEDFEFSVFEAGVPTEVGAGA